MAKLAGTSVLPPLLHTALQRPRTSLAEVRWGFTLYFICQCSYFPSLWTIESWLWLYFLMNIFHILVFGGQGSLWLMAALLLSLGVWAASPGLSGRCTWPVSVQGFLRLIKAKGGLCTVWWFSVRRPITPRTCADGRSSCSCEYVLNVRCDVTPLDCPHVQLLMVFLELKCLKCCMKYVTKIDFFPIFNTSELRVHGPISAIFNDLFSVYKWVKVNYNECAKYCGWCVTYSNDLL